MTGDAEHLLQPHSNLRRVAAVVDRHIAPQWRGEMRRHGAVQRLRRVPVQPRLEGRCQLERLPVGSGPHAAQMRQQPVFKCRDEVIIRPVIGIHQPRPRQKPRRLGRGQQTQLPNAIQHCHGNILWRRIPPSAVFQHQRPSRSC